MTNQIEKAKNLMEQGWKARENHEFEEAEKLLKEAMKIFEKEKDYFNVTECLNHLAYNEKLQAGVHLDEGIKLVNKAQKIVEKEGVRDEFVKRAAISISGAREDYGSALKYANEMLSEQEKVNSRDQADTLTHIALFHLREGSIGLAEEYTNKAEIMLEKHFDQIGDLQKYIWKTKLLLLKAQIEFKNGNKELATKLAKESLKLAKDNALQTRASQAKMILNSFKS